MTVYLSDQAKDLIRSNFFGKDFSTYVDELNDYLIVQFGQEFASNIVASEFGQVLIEMHAFALSTASWYGDRQADDTTLRYARLRSHANVIARQLGYKPSGAVPPAIELTILLNNAPTLTRLTIERGRSLIGPGGLNYLTTEEVVFDAYPVPEVGPKTVTAIEGEALEEIFTSDGTPGQFFFLETVPAGKSIAQDTPRVFVDTVEWTENPFLLFERTNQFEIEYGFNPPRLQFGDGIAGNIPPKEAEIRISYIATSGPNGSVQANTVTAFQQPLVAGVEVISATLSHNDPSTTGSARESIDSIRINAPLVTQTADRAVTVRDITAIINAYVDPVYGAVAIGSATVPRTVDDDAEALTIISMIESSCPLTLYHTTPQDPFILGDTVTGGTSGATGVVVGVGSSFLSVSSLDTGTFTSGEIITGGTSGASATLSTVSTSSIATRLENYWGSVLSSNCKANVVVGQILAADSNGRYVAAPAGLAQSLENHLNGMLESTVQAVVTDGSINLYSVSVSVEVNLASGYDNTVARANVFNIITKAIEAELLGRSYGDSLRISDLYAILDAPNASNTPTLTTEERNTLSAAIVYSHVWISAIDGVAPAPGALNQFGDLEVQSYEVITLGASPSITTV